MDFLRFQRFSFCFVQSNGLFAVRTFCHIALPLCLMKDQKSETANHLMALRVTSVISLTNVSQLILNDFLQRVKIVKLAQTQTLDD